MKEVSEKVMRNMIFEVLHVELSLIHIFNALSIRENKDGEIEYHISDEQCKRCGECVNHFTAGCYMRKVLAIKVARGNCRRE